MKKVEVSFKEGEEYLYDFLKKQMSVSIFIKELLKKQFEKENNV